MDLERVYWLFCRGKEAITAIMSINMVFFAENSLYVSIKTDIYGSILHI